MVGEGVAAQRPGGPGPPAAGASTTSPTGTTCRRGFRLVLREIDRYLATRTPRSAAATAPEPTAEVQGGRPAARRAERRADRRRPPTGGPGGAEGGPGAGGPDLDRDEGAPVDRGFEAAIARPDVALVLLAIRWSSHAFGDVKQFCDRHGKPLVRLPGGYSPNQVAAQILAQCSEQLGGG